jgi:hypothetical protein
VNQLKTHSDRNAAIHIEIGLICEGNRDQE